MIERGPVWIGHNIKEEQLWDTLPVHAQSGRWPMRPRDVVLCSTGIVTDDRSEQIQTAGTRNCRKDG